MIVDLSHFIEEGMPVYPGTEAPVLREANTLEEHGFREKLITMYSHTGTHIDAPAHILTGAPTLDALPLDRFYGRVKVLDVRHLAGAEIDVRDLDVPESGPEVCEYLLLFTGWDRFWGRSEYFEGYPVLSRAAARELTGHGLKGLGMDCISADPADRAELPIHRILMESGILIVENLRGLHRLPAGDGNLEFFCQPLRIRNADGSPVRAFVRSRGDAG